MYWRRIDPEITLAELPGFHFLLLRCKRGALLEVRPGSHAGAAWEVRLIPLEQFANERDHRAFQFGPSRTIGEIARSWRRRAVIVSTAPFDFVPAAYPPRPTPPPKSPLDHALDRVPGALGRSLRRRRAHAHPRPKPARRTPPTVRFRWFGEDRVSVDNVVDYARQRMGLIPAVDPNEERRRRALRRIGHLRAVYGEMRLDLVGQIDHPALFDGAAPTTAQFLASLWEAEHLPDDAAPATLEQAAARAEVHFATARNHAERVGIKHLPRAKRSQGRRAAKIARLAVDGATEGERQAALAQLREVLDSLALYYLPDGDDAARLLAERALAPSPDKEH